MIQKGQRGAKPHSKIHLPPSLPSVINDSVLKYEESDSESTPSDMDSPEHLENKPNAVDNTTGVVQEDFEQTNNTNALHKQSRSELVTPRMNFPLHFGQASTEFVGGPKMMHHTNMYDFRHNAVQYVDQNISNECYRVRDGVAEKIYSSLTSNSNTDLHSGNVIRPLPSYPYIGELGHLSNCLKQEANLVRAHSASSKDFGFGKPGRVLRLPIDNLYRSQSCEFPVNAENELTVPYSGNRPGHARSLSPRPDLQSEPEDLSVRGGTGAKLHCSATDRFNYPRGVTRCNSVESERTIHGGDTNLKNRSDSR